MAEKKQAEKRSAVIVELSQKLLECLPDKNSMAGIQEQKLSQFISTFLRTVSKENRIIFVRRYFLSETISEISRVLGLQNLKETA